MPAFIFTTAFPGLSQGGLFEEAFPGFSSPLILLDNSFVHSGQMIDIGVSLFLTQWGHELFQGQELWLKLSLPSA